MRYLIEKWIAMVLPVTIALMSLQGCSDDEPIPTPSPADDAYIGDLREISIVEALDDFHQAIFKCAIQAPDGTVITRTGTHQRIEGCARLTLDRGLCAGTYRLLYLLTPEVEGNDTIWVEYGLGCRVKLDADVPICVHFRYSLLANLRLFFNITNVNCQQYNINFLAQKVYKNKFLQLKFGNL